MHEGKYQADSENRSTDELALRVVTHSCRLTGQPGMGNSEVVDQLLRYLQFPSGYPWSVLVEPSTQIQSPESSVPVAVTSACEPEGTTPYATGGRIGELSACSTHFSKQDRAESKSDSPVETSNRDSAYSPFPIPRSRLTSCPHDGLAPEPLT